MRLYVMFGAAAVTAGILASGCGGLKVRDKDEASVARIKKVAVVGFSVVQPVSAGLSLNVGSGKVEGDRGGTQIPQSSSHADQMYADLAKQLSGKLGWTITPQKALAANAGYTQAYERTMKGFQNKMPLGEGKQQFLVAQVMDSDGTRILGKDGRDALIDALGVDAIVNARVNVDLKGTSIMGIGKRKPQAKMSFQVFRKGVENAVWFDGNVEGEESEESVGMTGFIDEKLLNRLAVQSAHTAFAKVGQTQQ